ncbi:MAG: InlB B-repeat-containing protein [Clostridiaceae bacterium]|nr:InlB B-repeat-containing protein [Eubacteriales bacterium]
MKGNLKRTFILFLACALILTSGAFNAALACDPEPQKYTVTYSYDNPVPHGAPSVPTEDPQEADVKVTLKDKPTMSGHVLTDWKVYKEGKHGWDPVTLNEDGVSFQMPAAKVKITAKWIEAVTVSYEYEPKIATPPDPDTVGKDVKFDLPSVSVDGYNFEGWFKPKNNNRYEKIEGQFSTNRNITLLGKWTAKEYEVSYRYTDAEPPEGANALLPDVSYTGLFAFNSSVPMADKPELPNYTFIGWTATNVSPDSIVGGEFIMPNGPVEFTGYWVPVGEDTPTYEVIYTFDLDSTPDGAKTPTDGGGHVKDIAFLLEEPSHPGYEFLGWKLWVEGGPVGGYVKEYTFTDEVYESVTFVGFWQKNEPPESPDPTPKPPKTPKPFERQNVSYMYTGAVPAGAPAAPELLWYLTPGTVWVADAPQLAGYVFSGWSTQDAAVKDGAFLLSGKNVVFTGFWTPLSNTELSPAAGVPKTGDEQALLLPGALALAGVALIVTALCRRDKKRGR